MSTVTSDALLALLYINNGDISSRWNFPSAEGTFEWDPGGLGEAVELTYSFLSSNPAGSGETGFSTFDADMIAATNDVLASIAAVANITFTQVGAQQGQITFGMSQHARDEFGNVVSSAYAYPPFYDFSVDFENSHISNISAEHPYAGNVWVNNDIDWIPSDWAPGNFGYAVLLHEMGHALGLNHSFEGDGAGGGYVLPNALDSERYTVMSYDYAPRSLLPTGYNLSPSTLMVMDIEALQHLYGANMQTATRDDPYRFARNEELLETIWDGGGKDTLDCSNQTLSCRIDLNDGEYSSIGMRLTDAELKLGLGLSQNYALTDYERDNFYNGVDNLGIAKGTIIEDAFGGSAADTLLGNGVANRLYGGGGADRITAGVGNDRLDGGAAADVLTGQAGNDIVVGGAGADRMDGGTGRDVFDYNRFADTGRAAAGADVIAGFVSGQDRIDLSTLDANTTVTGNQVFTFIGSAAFTEAGQVRYAGGVLYASNDADATAELAIQLSGVALSAPDLIL